MKTGYKIVPSLNHNDLFSEEGVTVRDTPEGTLRDVERNAFHLLQLRDAERTACPFHLLQLEGDIVPGTDRLRVTSVQEEDLSLMFGPHGKDVVAMFEALPHVTPRERRIMEAREWIDGPPYEAADELYPLMQNPETGRLHYAVCQIVLSLLDQSFWIHGGGGIIRNVVLAVALRDHLEPKHFETLTSFWIEAKGPLPHSEDRRRPADS